MEGFNINGKILIGIDHGYGNMKTRHTVFKSGVKCYEAEPSIATSILEYGGKYYVIGEGHKVFIANKNEDDDYYILTLAAIAKELEIRGLNTADVVLAVGLPLNWMANQKKDFMEYLLRKKEVEFKFSRETYHIRICDVQVYKDRIDWNVYYIQQSLGEAYAQIFGPAIEEYNAKQKRKDRWVTDYLTDIKNSGNNEKQFYEIVVQIGKKEDTGVLNEGGELSVDAKAAQEILDEYVRSFQERNPNLYLFNAVLHMDEATPHLHLDYIPVAHGYKTKMHTRNSLTKALQEMGIEPATSKLDNETMHWQKRERDFLMGICRERGLEVEVLGEKRDNYTIPEYKAARQAADEINAELEILNSERQEAEAMLASVNSEAENSRGEMEESKKHLEEINSEIAEREKRCKAYEQKIDKIISAGKPVKKELDTIRKKTKELPSLLGGEKYIRITETDFERVMDMAQAAGTLEKLNEAYDKDMDIMQGKIDKLTSQVQILKDKITKTEAFLKFKGLLEEFKESLKPKSLKRDLQDKQSVVDERMAMRPKIEIKKDKGIAI